MDHYPTVWPPHTSVNELRRRKLVGDAIVLERAAKIMLHRQCYGVAHALDGEAALLRREAEGDEAG